MDALCFRDVMAEVPAEDAWGALLAGQLLVENVEMDTVSAHNLGKVQRVQAHLMHLLAEGQFPAVERVAGGKILAHLGDPRSGVGLRESGLPNIEWVKIPAGSFVMGSSDEDERAYSHEKPQHCYEIAEMYMISRYPVTQAQYAAFVQAGGYEQRLYWSEAGWSRKEKENWSGPEEYGMSRNLPNHPVVGVSWYESLAYCIWLTEMLQRLSELSSVQEVQLPSEAEWAKAARGTDGRIYPWGNDLDLERASYSDTGIGGISAVGCFPNGASSYGVEDMSGNVWEWTRSHYKDYPYQDDDGREDLDVGDDIPRVMRGGAFYDDGGFARCASRYMGRPFRRYEYGGFRVCIVSRQE